MSQPSAVLVSDAAKADKAAEDNYTKKYLAEISEAADNIYAEFLTLSPYAQFYKQNNEAGYAFHMLQFIFKKIDALIGINSMAGRSPWEYFSDLQLLDIEISRKRVSTRFLRVNPLLPIQPDS